MLSDFSKSANSKYFHLYRVFHFFYPDADFKFSNGISHVFYINQKFYKINKRYLFITVIYAKRSWFSRYLAIKFFFANSATYAVRNSLVMPAVTEIFST